VVQDVGGDWQPGIGRCFFLSALSFSGLKGVDKRVTPYLICANGGLLIGSTSKSCGIGVEIALLQARSGLALRLEKEECSV